MANKRTTHKRPRLEDFDEEKIEKNLQAGDEIRKAAEQLRNTELDLAPDLNSALCIAFLQLNDIEMVVTAIRLAYDLRHLETPVSWQEHVVRKEVWDAALKLCKLDHKRKLASVAEKLEPIVLAPPKGRCPLCGGHLTDAVWKQNASVFMLSGVKMIPVLRLYCRKCKASVKPFCTDLKGTARRYYHQFKDVDYVQVSKETYWDKHLSEFYVCLV